MSRRLVESHIYIYVVLYTCEPSRPLQEVDLLANAARGRLCRRPHVLPQKPKHRRTKGKGKGSGPRGVGRGGLVRRVG